jgi:hypothetical protein
MAVRLTLILALLALALMPTTAQGHALVPCSAKQSVDRQMACGKLNRHHGVTSLRFLKNNKQAGTVGSRFNLRRAAKYLIKYGNRHMMKASDRRLGTMPSAIYTDSCLRELIRREASGFVPEDKSTWFAAARRPNGQGSGAYGVPQALPGEKMASAGSDWSWNPVTQVRWMIGYVNGRYGGSCAALAHHNSAGYY